MRSRTINLIKPVKGQQGFTGFTGFTQFTGFALSSGIFFGHPTAVAYGYRKVAYRKRRFLRDAEARLHCSSYAFHKLAI